MTETLIKGMVKTIIDGIKDAQMQYEYAETALKQDDHTFAALHINEAHKRLMGVCEWYKKAKDVIGEHGDDDEDDIITDVLVNEYKDWYYNLKQRVESMKATHGI
jgi:hypothetical protein